jgi:Family of unknown function (DUF6221)
VDDIAATAAFIEARLAELEWTARHSGPHRVAWLTLYRPDGSLHYTTTGAELGPLGDNQGWCADGRELPASTTAMVVYDPASVLRDVSQTRSLVAEILSIPHDEDWLGCAARREPGRPCDCGRDTRVLRMLGIIAARWEPAC